MSTPSAAGAIARAIVDHSKECFSKFPTDESRYASCAHEFCGRQCSGATSCEGVCFDHAGPLFAKFSQVVSNTRPETRAAIETQVQQAAGEQAAAMKDLQDAQERMKTLNSKLAARAQRDMQSN